MVTPEEDSKLDHCPALTALKAISGKWKTRTLWLLRQRPHHFNELRRAMPAVSAKVLTEQMRELEDDDILERHETTKDGIVHVVYSYSDYGKTLIPVLDQLGAWGLIHDARMAGGEKPPRE